MEMPVTMRVRYLALTSTNLTGTIADVKVQISCCGPVAMTSQPAEYAPPAIVDRAGYDGVARTTPEIAETTHIPAAFLANVTQSLSRARLAKSRRGIHGGFILAHDSRELAILAVVNANDPIQRLNEYPLRILNRGTRLSLLDRRLDHVAALAIQRALSHRSAVVLDA